jgi:hypothetical protein
VGGFGRAKLILTSGAVVLSAAVAWVGLDGQRSSPGEVALTLVTGWSFVASGLVAWRMCGSPGCRSGRWPTNLIGPVMVVTGLLRLAPGLEPAQNPVLFTIGDALEPAYVVGVVYLVLAFPEGRLAGTLERLLVGAAFVAVLPLTVTWLALGGTHGPCNDCRESLLVIADVPDVYTPLHNVTLGGGAVVAVVSIGVLGRRWHLATPRLRFAIAPVLWVGAAVFVVIGVWLSEMVIRDDHRAISDALFGITLAFVPIAFLVGVARTRLARSAVADLVIELGSTPPPGELLEALARALRDPSLKVAYWLPDTERYVDALGRTVSLPKATTEAGRDDGRARWPPGCGADPRSGAASGPAPRPVGVRGGRAGTRERTAPGRVAGAAGRPRRVAQSHRRSRGDRTAAHRARSPRRHPAAARVRRYDPRPRRIQGCQ